MQAGQRIAGAASVLAMALIGLYMVAVGVNVFARHGFRAPLAIISDMAEFLIPSALSLAFLVAALNGSHLSIRFLGAALGPRTGRALDLLGRMATLLLLGVITWRLYDYAQYVNATSRASTLRNIPLWPVWAFVTLALGCATLATLFTPLSAPSSAPPPRDGAGGTE